MNVEEIRDYCLSLGEDVEEKFPFTKFKKGDTVLVFYVCQHMFCFFDIEEMKVISVKCQSERIPLLKVTTKVRNIGWAYNPMSARPALSKN